MTKEKHIQSLLEEIFKHLGENPAITIETSGEDVINISVEGNNLNFLIGYRGQSLEALQTIVRMATFRKFSDTTTVILDINGYKNRKAEKIKDLARKYIDKVRFHREDTELPAMNPWERRHVHVLVSEYDDIESESIGTGEDRRVILKSKIK